MRTGKITEGECHRNGHLLCSTWRRKWQPTPVFLPGKSNAQGSPWQGTVKSILQHHSSKASIFWCSAFFTLQLLQPYVTTGKTSLDCMDLCQVSNVGFSTHCLDLSVFLQRNNSSDFVAAVTIHSDFIAQEEEICHYFYLFPFYLPCSNEARCHNLIIIFIFNI